MTPKNKSRNKTWTAVLHDRGGYALFDSEGRVVGRYLNREIGIREHAQALQALQCADKVAIHRYPIVFQTAEELSGLATTPFVKPKIAKRSVRKVL